jgi:type I restriction-modification system DNA methylase subunit
VFGLDLDKEVVEKWKKINLLHLFNGNKEDLEAHFFCQNGLDKIHWEQHKKKYGYKLKGEDIKNQQFDTVVGNPPYGGIGLGGIELSNDLIAQLNKFEVLPEEIADNLVFAHRQSDLFNSQKAIKAHPQIKQRLANFPIEILFIDRFIQLTKPGGSIAVIIPDGILANSNLQYARAFIARKAKVAAIVSLPRDAFKHMGTAAKTSILFLQKYGNEEQKNASLDYSIFLSAIEEINEENLKIISDLYQKFYNEGIV